MNLYWIETFGYYSIGVALVAAPRRDIAKGLLSAHSAQHSSRGWEINYSERDMDIKLVKHAQYNGPAKVLEFIEHGE